MATWPESLRVAIDRRCRVRGDFTRMCRSIGFPRPTVYSWLRGQIPHGSTCARIERFFGKAALGGLNRLWCGSEPRLDANTMPIGWRTAEDERWIAILAAFGVIMHGATEPSKDAEGAEARVQAHMDYQRPRVDCWRRAEDRRLGR